MLACQLICLMAIIYILFQVIITAIIQTMGMTSIFTSSTSRLLSPSLRIVSQSDRRVVLQDSCTHQEYLFIKKLIDPATRLKEEHSLKRRKELTSKPNCIQNEYCLPILVDYQYDTVSLCNEFTYVSMLFQHPSKCLKQQIINRIQLTELLTQGEMWTIVYSILTALIHTQPLGVDPSLSDANVFIAKDGSIILSDVHNYEMAGSTSIYRNQGRNQSEPAEVLKQLGQMVNRILRMFQEVHLSNMSGRIYQKKCGGADPFSPVLINFVDMLACGHFHSFVTTLEFILELRNSASSASSTPTKSQERSSQMSSQRMSRLHANHQVSTHHTPIMKLMSTVKKSSQDASMENSTTNNNHSVNIKSFIYGKDARKDEEHKDQHKENIPNQNTLGNPLCQRCSAKHSKSAQPSSFLPISTQSNQSSSFLCHQCSATFRLDDVSSIKSSHTQKLTQEDEAAINAIINEGCSPNDQHNSHQHNYHQHNYHNQYQPHFKQLFSTDSRLPLKSLAAMKNLIINQKDIIYEQSQNDISSLASHRHTRNVSAAFSNEGAGSILRVIQQQ